MKKLLLSLFTLVCALTAQATVITNLSDYDFEGDGDSRSAVINGYKITFEKYKSTTNCANSYASSGGHIRVYKDAKFIIEAQGTAEAIKNVQLVCLSGNINNLTDFDEDNAQEITTIEGSNVIWKSSDPVTTFEGWAHKGQLRITKIIINELKEDVEIAGTGEGTVESPYDVTRALSLIENSKYTTSDVYVKGLVSSVDKLGTSGGLTYFISQDGAGTSPQLTVYYGLNLGGEMFKSTEDLKAMDEVVVCGKLTNYNGTYEFSSNSVIYSLNGKTYQKPDYTPTGDGSKENPYTVADIKGLNIKTSDGNKYWVKGFILGSVASGTALSESDKLVATNLAIGATADATEFIPVELPSGDVRTALNVVDNADNIGVEVMVYGTLEAYFSVAGVKKVTEYQLNKEEEYKLVGDGSKEKPYTVEDVLFLKKLDGADTAEWAWVQGMIIGCPKNTYATTFNTGVGIMDGYLAFGPVVNEAANYLYVKIIDATLKSEIGLKSHPEILGKTIKVHGQLMKAYTYYTSVQNIDQYEWVEDTNGIATIETVENPNAPIYNIAGQKVGADYKGIIIKNGKKYLNK